MVQTERSRPPIRRLWCAVLFGYLAFGGTLQALTRWVPDQLGGGPIETGVAVGAAFAATAIARPFAGRAGDAGLARAAVIASGLLVASGALGQLVAPNLLVMVIARLVMGLGEAALFSAALPWVLHGLAPERRASVAGWFGLSMWGGLALGPLVVTAGGLLLDPEQVWWVIIGFGLVAAAFAATTPAGGMDRRGRLRPEHWREVLPRGAALPGVVFGLGAYGYGTIASGLVLFLDRSQLGGSGVALAVFAGAFLIARAVGSPVVDRWGGPRTTIVTSAVVACGFVLLALAASITVALAGAAVVGGGLSLALPATVLTTLTRTGGAGAGNAVATATSFWDLGILVAGPLSGLIAAGAGFSAMFAAAAACAVVALVLSVALRSASAQVVR
ncbi:MFS transporter [Pseudonocardia phyllosphaerae]|uniref:MFS transporter n=1 Tax=Pseudonocardia phyllosphaerae TaxID=3390502 RepID=UPI003978FB1B